ncbi:MAG: hypothetical protein RML40_10190 [Bacteroidota bacterium]|nr:hypothetical protein [Candidatus Kapabacteria bacterium]MDW8220889.1 hypothetical protein [Bacteroidota bacterium]
MIPIDSSPLRTCRVCSLSIKLMLSITCIVSLYGVYSCGRVITDPAEIVIPSSNVSFERHVLPLFSLACNTTGCHNAHTRAGGVALTSYFDVVFATPGLVVAGKPEQSILMRVIDFTSRTRIPHRESFQSRITQNHIDGVRTWILEGAL